MDRMNNEQIRIALADYLNIRWHGDPSWPIDPNTPYWEYHGFLYCTVPNYPADLNLMHELEQMLSDEQKTTYFTRLHDVMEEVIAPNLVFAQDIVFATPLHKAEAFLRTVDKWIE